MHRDHSRTGRRQRKRNSRVLRAKRLLALLTVPPPPFWAAALTLGDPLEQLVDQSLRLDLINFSMM